MVASVIRSPKAVIEEGWIVELVGRSAIFLDACAGVRAELHTDTGSDQFSHEGATCAESLQLRSVEIRA